MTPIPGSDAAAELLREALERQRAYEERRRTRMGRGAERLTAHDAAYLELAMRRGLPLASRDQYGRQQVAEGFPQEVLATALDHFGMGGQAEGELHHTLVQERRAHLQRVGHAGEVHLVQHVVGQGALHIGQEHAVHVGHALKCLGEPRITCFHSRVIGLGCHQRIGFFMRGEGGHLQEPTGR